MTTYSMKNIDCADCAARIETKIRSLTNVRYASLNFATLSLTLDTDDFESVRREIEQIEPSVEIVGGLPKGAAKELGHGDDDTGRGKLLILFALSAVYGLGFFVDSPYGTGIFILVWAAAGFRVVRAAVGNLFRGRLFDENFLMTVATVGALLIGAFSEAAGVMVFYAAGEYLEGLSLRRSRRSIRALVDLKPDTACVLQPDGARLTLPTEEVEVGMKVLVRPGERVPLDGEVLEGSSWLDTAALTGEAVPRPVNVGGAVLAGMINTSGLLTVRVEKPYAESSAAKILKLVEEAAGRKSRTEKFMTRFARYYTPAVLVLALLVAVLPPLLFEGMRFSDWIYRGLVVLVISCPCALVVSIPLGYFGGIGGAARRGILIKGSNFIDSLAKIGTLVFDKTGTLTEGVFHVIRTLPASGFTKEDILRLAAEAEAGSNHPIALALRGAVSGRFALPENFTEFPGRGVSAEVGGKTVLAGSSALLSEQGVALPAETLGVEKEAGSAFVYLSVDGTYAGKIEIGDELRPEAAEAVLGLHAAGVKRILVLSGDTPERVGYTRDRLGIDEAVGGLLPEDKARILQDEKGRSRGLVAFVGDGLNDAPVLALSDVGIAMGGVGQDAAVETADVVIMNDDLRKIPRAMEIARKTRGIVFQNIALALVVKLVFVAGGLFGLAGMWEAVFADVGVAVLAVLNSMRAMKA